MNCARGISPHFIWGTLNFFHGFINRFAVILGIKSTQGFNNMDYSQKCIFWETHNRKNMWIADTQMGTSNWLITFEQKWLGSWKVVILHYFRNFRFCVVQKHVSDKILNGHPALLCLPELGLLHYDFKMPSQVITFSNLFSSLYNPKGILLLLIPCIIMSESGGNDTCQSPTPAARDSTWRDGRCRPMRQPLSFLWTSCLFQV